MIASRSTATEVAPAVAEIGVDVSDELVAAGTPAAAQQELSRP